MCNVHLNSIASFSRNCQTYCRILASSAVSYVRATLISKHRRKILQTIGFMRAVSSSGEYEVAELLRIERFCIGSYSNVLRPSLNRHALNSCPSPHNFDNGYYWDSTFSHIKKFKSPVKTFAMLTRWLLQYK